MKQTKKDLEKINKAKNRTIWEYHKTNEPDMFSNIWHSLVQAIGDRKQEYIYSCESQEKATAIISKLGFEKALSIIAMLRGEDISEK